MLKKLAGMIVLIGLICSCDRNQKETMVQRELDSLRSELALSQKTTETLQEVGALMDSIDASRNYLRTNILEGLPNDIYVNRMRDINSFVKSSQAKIEDLEKALKATKYSRNTYAASVKQMKQDLESRNQQIAALTEQITNFKTENEVLQNTVALQGVEINNKAEELTLRQQELIELQEQLSNIVEQAKSDIAEAYYAQAQALELAAKRTNFAPRKKRNTRREALELYKLSVVSGKPEAQTKVEELEKEI